MKKVSEDIILNENQELKQFINEFKTVINDLNTEVEISKELLDINIQTTFTKLVNDVLTDPLKANFRSYKTIETGIKMLLNDSIINYLSKFKTDIELVAKMKNTGSILHYSILFKTDNKINTKNIIRFSGTYEKTPYSRQFPIALIEIPVSLQQMFKESELSSEHYEIIEL